MSQIYLPDALSCWPFPRRINPHYNSVKPVADEWVHGLNVLDQRAQDAFDKCDFTLCAALVYPELDATQLRVGSDLMMLFFVFDEFTDKVSRAKAQVYIDIVIDALERPDILVPAQGRDDMLREMTRQFWTRAIAIAPASAQRGFVTAFVKYIKAVALEAQDRTDDNIRSIDSYLALRRLTAAGHSVLFLAESSVDIPYDVMQHPSLVSLTDFFADSIIFLNDVYSYNIEQASGHHAHNLVTVVMHEKNISVQEEMDWIGRYHVQLLERFESLKANLPSWGADIDREVSVYTRRLAQGIRGVDAWSFETQRYFGPRGEEVRQTRLVTLFPKVVSQESQPLTPMTILEAVKDQGTN